MENKFNLHFDIGLDPDLHMARAAEELSDEKPMLLLSAVAGEEKLTGAFAAGFLPAAFTACTQKQAEAYAAELLRLCYGKINFLFCPVSFPGVLNACAKLFKAYRKDTRVIGVTAPGTVLPDALQVQFADEFISVSPENALAAACETAKTEHTAFGEAAGAVLYAAKTAAEKENKKHARYVLLLPEAE